VRNWRSITAVAVAIAAVAASGAGAAPYQSSQLAQPKPLADGWLPDNPHMSSSGANSMHGDTYASDTHPWAGPVSPDAEVTFSGKGPCAGMGVTREKLLLLQCGGAQNFTLRLVDPKTLEDLASYKLPPRPSTMQAVEHADLDKVYSDSSGAYFFIDDVDQAVVADAAQHIQRIDHAQAQDGSWSFRQTDDWDLSGYLPHDCTTYTNPLPQGKCDPITGVLPDWNGLLWWITRFGRVGTLDPQTGKVKLVRLAGEEIENSHAVSEDGVSVVTDHALYEFRARPDGTPYVVWKARYDRGSQRKVGQINQGSGTTPTMLGKKYVAITDNADPRMHVNVYKRADHVTGKRLVCSVPVFGKGASASENSIVGWGNGLLVENNSGYLNPTTRVAAETQPGGVTKVAVGRDGCHVAWTNPVLSPSVVPKLARGNGMLYLYSPQRIAPGLDDWGLTVVDWRTGKTVTRIHTGNGAPYDNAWAPITLGPGGVAYISCFGGLISVRDS
jgi:hypothetical protein